MIVQHIKSGLLGVNSYFIIADDNKSAILIDGGEKYNLIKDVEKQLGINIKALLLTHGHYDHVGNAKKLQLNGVKVYIGANDADKLLNGDKPEFRVGKVFESLKADVVLHDGQEIDLFGIKVKVIETPGHTNGSVTYMIEDMLFTGDTLLRGCVGRTDFFTGSDSDMQKSLKKLFSLEGDYKIFPGHDRFTTLSYEREYNPFYKNV